MGNSYSFAGNDPVNRVDPSGRESLQQFLGDYSKLSFIERVLFVPALPIAALGTAFINDDQPAPTAPPPTRPLGPDMRPEPPIPVGFNAGLAPEGTGIFKPAELSPEDYRDAQELAKAILFIMGSYAGVGRVGSLDDAVRAENIRKFQQIGGTRTRPAGTLGPRFGSVGGAGGAGAGAELPPKLGELVAKVGGMEGQCARGTIALNKGLLTGSTRAITPGKRLRGSYIFTRLKIKPDGYVSHADDLVDDLSTVTKPGDVGVVWGKQVGKSEGHIFHFVNYRGKIHLLDSTQPGGVIDPTRYDWDELGTLTWEFTGTLSGTLH